ncbi:MAG: right-handed parallel beta-helix repeat-containing protein [Gammaproteobacteria bacterium]
MHLVPKIRKLYTLNIFLLLIVIANQVVAYEPPIGIPSPPFGIDESHTMYAGQTYQAGGFTYRDAGNGPYTHYIDGSSADCTNSGNPYGTVEQPRCGMPTNDGVRRSVNIPEGSVIEIHGGLSSSYNRSGIYQITIDGTADKPVFIRGYSSTESQYPQYVHTDFRIAGRYGIIEQLDIYDDCQFVIKPSYDLTGANRSDHISVRNMHIHEPVGDSGDMTGSSAIGDYLVYYNNHVHNHWRDAATDAHGLYIGSPSSHAWILETHIYGNSGNGFQSCNACSATPPEFIYVGKNTFHGDKELAIGMKYANHVIISQNTIYDYHESTTATGTGIVIGADGPTNNVWMIFNEIYNAPYGIRIEESDTDVYILGNIIHDITNAALNLEKEGPNVYLINNTINNVGQFINQTWRDNFILHARNNIFSNYTNSVGIVLKSKTVADPSVMDNNLFYDDSGSVAIDWASDRDTYSSTSDLMSFSSGSNNLYGSANFHNMSLDNYIPNGSSPAINSGDTEAESSAIYDTYQTRYGIDIKVDYNGNRRPYGSGWDIGAFETGASSPIPAPNPPKLFIK